MAGKQNLETLINDVTDQAEVNDTLMQKLVAEMHAAKDYTTPANKVLPHLDHIVNLVQFTALQTALMARRLKQGFHESLEG